jgi:CheY-like chemotaxis protein
LSEELVWLNDAQPEPATSVGEALHTAVNLVQPLARQWNVPLQIDLQEDLAELPVAQLALRTILLTLLNLAIPRAGSGRIAISAKLVNSDLELMVACLDCGNAASLPFEGAAGLETAQDLAVHYGARLVLEQQKGGGFAFALTLPRPKRIPILVIDDNADWLDLLQRYAADSRFQVTGTRDPEAGRRQAQERQPAAILLDVMMQNIDGWEILSALRYEPATSDIPVVICTVLPVKDLALALGADDFLQKPVTQEQFLRMLERHVLPSH